MPLSFKEEIRMQAAFMEVTRGRRLALENMFVGTSLQVRSYAALAEEAIKEAKKAKKAVANVSGIEVPDLNAPELNIGIFKGLDLPKLLKVHVPGISIPDFPAARIPNITLGRLPGFDLPKFRLNLKGVLRHKDILPDINLRVMIWGLRTKWPHLSLASLVYDLGRLMDIDLPDLIPGFKVAFPEFYSPDFEVSLPNLSMPDINLPSGIPIPNLEVPVVNLPSLDIPGLDMPKLLKLPGFDKVMKLLLELFDTADLPDILGELGMDFMTDFISSALPIVQQVKSGAQAAKEWGNAAQDLYKAKKTEDHEKYLVPGDAKAACRAIKTLLQQSSADHAVVATIKTSQCAVSTAGLFLDLGGATGPAVSGAAALAKLCHKVTIFGLKYKEMKRVNAILSTSPGHELTRDLFNVSPLLGCYFIANNDTMVVLNVIAKDFMTSDWMDDAHNNKKKHLDPLIKDAQNFIGKSRYVLTPLRQTKGMYVQRGTIEKMKEGAKLYAKKKLGRAPTTAKVASHRYIG